MGKEEKGKRNQDAVDLLVALPENNKECDLQNAIMLEILGLESKFTAPEGQINASEGHSNALES